jgi:hypothetical protein
MTEQEFIDNLEILSWNFYDAFGDYPEHWYSQTQCIGKYDYHLNYTWYPSTKEIYVQTPDRSSWVIEFADTLEEVMEKCQNHWESEALVIYRYDENNI